MAKIALYRPGALGDVIMTLNYSRVLMRSNEVTYFCDKSVYSVLNEFVTANKLVNKFTVTDDYVASDFDKTLYLIGYPLDDGYPHIKMKSHLLWYFAREMGVTFSFNEFHAVLPNVPVSIQRRHVGQNQKPRYFTIQTKTGWSAYKEWWGWHELVPLLRKEFPDIAIYQLGGPSDPVVDGVDGSYCGDPFEINVAVQANATLHLGLDSVLNHTTNISWQGRGKVPAVVLFGSTQADASGYPHNVNISLSLPCQPCFRENPAMARVPLGPCVNPPNQVYENPNHSCMRQITPSMVLDAVKQQLAKS